MKTKYTVALSALAGVAIGAIAMQGLHAQSKPPVYVVAEIDVTDVDNYVKEYAPKAQAAIKGGGGRLLAVGQNAISVEGAPPAKRVAIQEWPSMEQFKAYRASAALADARKIGDKYAKFRTWAIEGVAQ
jgi:uncharacterized protein (DUF1330 family)